MSRGPPLQITFASTKFVLHFSHQVDSILLIEDSKEFSAPKEWSEIICRCIFTVSQILEAELLEKTILSCKTNADSSVSVANVVICL